MAVIDPKHFPIIPPTPGPEIAPARALAMPPIEVRRQGIIPCRRCAFFVEGSGAWVATQKAQGVAIHGACALHRKREDVFSDHGCGDGLLREEAAPLPPEVET
jgi:hypothetical protein